MHSLPALPMGQPPMGGAGDGSIPSGSPGESAHAVSKLREAVRIMEGALNSLPIGSEIHKAVLNAIQSISKHAPASEAVPGVQMSTLANLQQNARQNQSLMMLQRMFEGGAGGGAAGGPPASAAAASPGSAPPGAA